MKKISLILVAFVLLISSFSFATQDASSGSNIEEGASFSISSETDVKEELKKENGNASETTIGRILTKEEKINDYKKRFNGNETNAIVLYYLELIREYSIPICFIGIAIAAFNFSIVGNKKLEKREQGFRMLVTIIVGLIVFQILPLLFALIVGR